MAYDIGAGNAAEFAELKRQHKTNGAAPRPRLKPIPWSEMSTLPKREPLIKGLLDRGAFSVIYGPSGTGKTHFALDLAAHVARGTEWRGRKVRQGGVLYIAAEGGLGIAERLEAYRLHYQIEPKGLPFFVLPAAVDLCGSAADADEIVAEAEAALGTALLDFIIVDTVSRALAGGNENAPDDMGKLVGNVDRLRSATKAKAHVAAIHHTGKETDRGARGHSLLKAAADTEIEIARDEATRLVTATVTKQRDHPQGGVFMSRLEVVSLGSDADGDALTSCIIVAADDGERVPRRARKPLSPTAQLALDELHNCIIDHADDPTPTPDCANVPEWAKGVDKGRWRERLEKAGIINADGSPREQLRRLVIALKNADRIGAWEDFVWPVTARHTGTA